MSFEEWFGALPMGEAPNLDMKAVMIVKEDVMLDVVPVSARAVDCVNQMSTQVLDCLSNNQLLRQGIIEQRSYKLERLVKIEGEGEMSVVDGFRWAYRTGNKKLLRSLGREKDHLMEYAENIDSKDGLVLFRALRSLKPAVDKASKKIETHHKGDSTLSKISYLVDLYKNISSVGKPRILLYGAAGPHHRMSFLPGVVKCYDLVGMGTPFYVKGSVEDWEKHLKEDHYDLAIMDCSLSDGESGGMSLPRRYEELAKQIGKVLPVIAKVNKFGSFVGTKVAGVKAYRLHNCETFVLLMEGRNVKKFPDYEMDVYEANYMRMRAFYNGMYEIGLGKKEADKDLIEHVLLMGLRRKEDVYLKGAVDVLVKDFDPHLETLIDLCMKEKIRPVDMDEYLELDIELPCIIMDVGFLSSDAFRLFYSFVEFYELEYDPDVGWVAVEKKKDVF